MGYFLNLVHSLAVGILLTNVTGFQKMLNMLNIERKHISIKLAMFSYVHFKECDGDLFLDAGVGLLIFCVQCANSLSSSRRHTVLAVVNINWPY